MTANGLHGVADGLDGYVENELIAMKRVFKSRTLSKNFVNGLTRI